MKIYRTVPRKPPVLVGESKLQLLPVHNPGEPISGWALQIDGYLVELSFVELDRIAEARKGERS